VANRVDELSRSRQIEWELVAGYFRGLDRTTGAIALAKDCNPTICRVDSASRPSPRSRNSASIASVCHARKSLARSAHGVERLHLSRRRDFRRLTGRSSSRKDDGEARVALEDVAYVVIDKQSGDDDRHAAIGLHGGGRRHPDHRCAPHAERIDACRSILIIGKRASPRANSRERAISQAMLAQDRGRQDRQSSCAPERRQKAEAAAVRGDERTSRLRRPRQCRGAGARPIGAPCSTRSCATIRPDLRNKLLNYGYAVMRAAVARALVAFAACRRSACTTPASPTPSISPTIFSNRSPVVDALAAERAVGRSAAKKCRSRIGAPWLACCCARPD